MTAAGVLVGLSQKIPARLWLAPAFAASGGALLLAVIFAGLASLWRRDPSASMPRLMLTYLGSVSADWEVARSVMLGFVGVGLVYAVTLLYPTLGYPRYHFKDTAPARQLAVAGLARLEPGQQVAVMGESRAVQFAKHVSWTAFKPTQRATIAGGRLSSTQERRDAARTDHRVAGEPDDRRDRHPGCAGSGGGAWAPGSAEPKVIPGQQALDGREPRAPTTAPAMPGRSLGCPPPRGAHGKAGH
jgi:hypothetical protein